MKPKAQNKFYVEWRIAPSLVEHGTPVWDRRWTIHPFSKKGTSLPDAHARALKLAAVERDRFEFRIKRHD